MADSVDETCGITDGDGHTCVLVVDDHAPALYAKSHVLAGAGFRVLEASTGGDALHVVSERHPDVVVLDVRLPDIDGITVCRTIKENPSTATTMVLQVSAYCTSTEDQVLGLDSGADAYMPGDVPAPLLIAMVRALLRARLAERTVHEQRERLRWARAVEESEQKLRALAARLLTVQEDERRRIGREVHDDLCQRLASLEMGLERARRAHPDASEDLEPLSRQIAGISRNLRDMSHALHPAVIEHVGLPAGLQTLCEDFERLHELPTRCECSLEDEELPLTVAMTLYRIAQEALRNVVKHAGDARVWVTLRGNGRNVSLVVHDDGCGFECADPANAGLGFVSIRERANLVGGEMRVVSAPGQGTTVEVHVPLHATAGA